MNQLTVLGGSAAGIGTGQGCSGYLLQIDGSNIVLDMGPSTLIELRKHVDYRQLNAIVISHLHMDHVLDLFILRFMLSYNPVKAERKIPLFLPPGGLAFMAKAADLWATDASEVDTYFDAVFDMQEYDPERQLTIRSAEISFTPTAHPVPCWAMRVRTENSDDLVYTADTGTDADLTEFAKGAAILIADSASGPDTPDAAKQGVHFDAAAAAQLAHDADVHHLMLSHQWEELDPIRNTTIARETFQSRISIATPGVTVSW